MATRAARQVFDELEEVEALRADLKQAAVVRDIVPEHVLLDWLDVSRKTLKRWDVPVQFGAGADAVLPHAQTTWPRKRRTKSSSLS